MYLSGYATVLQVRFLTLTLSSQLTDSLLRSLSAAMEIAGLAGLVGGCMEAIERVDSYRNFRSESRLINDRFDCEKLLFRQWSDKVGITGGKLKGVHHPSLDDDAVLAVVERILSSIHELFVLTEPTVLGLQFRSTDNDTTFLNSLELSKDNSTKRKHQAFPSTRGKLSWAFKGKARFITQVELFGELIDKLYRLVPPEGASKSITLDLIRNPEELSNSLDGTPPHVIRLHILLTQYRWPEAKSDLARGVSTCAP